MKLVRRVFSFVLVGAFALSFAQDPLPATVVPVEDLAPTRAGSYDWLKRHEAVVSRVKEGKVDLLLIGDSITHGWGGVPTEGVGPNPLWDKYFAKWNTVNLGFGWDRTQHVLWRFEHGEIDGITPKAAVVMIGTNNIGSDSPADIATGVAAILKQLRTKLPQTKILLLGIFPRDREPTSQNRKLVGEVNSRLSSMGSREGPVFYLDLTPKFLEPDGTISREIMRDYLHPTPKGYEIWGDAMAPVLAKLMGEK